MPETCMACRSQRAATLSTEVPAEAKEWGIQTGQRVVYRELRMEKSLEKL